MPLFYSLLMIPLCVGLYNFGFGFVPLPLKGYNVNLVGMGMPTYPSYHHWQITRQVMSRLFLLRP